MIALQDQRVLFSDNGTLADWSTDLGDFRQDTQVMAFVSAEDYLYVGSFLPFNHRYFDVSSANAVSATPSVEVWYSDRWEPAVDIIDETLGLQQSGILRWTTDREKGWSREVDSFDVDGLAGTVIYQMYWVRFRWDADLTPTTALNYVGHRFATEDVLYSYYPDLNQANLKTAFEAGKTTWDEQLFMASETIIRELRKHNIIKSPDQILVPEMFEEPCVHKCAEIIYGAFGDGYKDDRSLARNSYREAVNVDFFNVDLDGNARLTPIERNIHGRLKR